MEKAFDGGISKKINEGTRTRHGHQEMDHAIYDNERHGEEDKNERRKKLPIRIRIGSAGTGMPTIPTAI